MDVLHCKRRKRTHFAQAWYSIHGSRFIIQAHGTEYNEIRCTHSSQDTDDVDVLVISSSPLTFQEYIQHRYYNIH